MERKTAKDSSNKEELDLGKIVTVTNIAGWPVTFKRLTGLGDVIIVPGGRMQLTRNEIISQVQIGNKLFVGPLGDGDHPTLYIEDEQTRIELGFDSEDGSKKQKVYTDDVALKLFAIESLSDFKQEVQNEIKTRAEKYAIIETIKKSGLNDYNKIRYLEEYTGYKVI